MKNILGILAALVILLLASCSQTPTQDLKSLYINTANYDSAVDASATNTGVYVVGDFGDQSANEGITLHKYDFNGNILWTKQVSTSGFDDASGVATNANGIIYMLGSTSGALAGKLGDYDNFVRAYNESGSVLWTRQFGTSNLDNAKDIVLTSTGNALILSNEIGVTLRKVTNTGVVSPLVRNSTHFPIGVTVDSTGNIFILAYQNIFNGSSNKVNLLKYTSSGSLLSTTFVDWGIAQEGSIASNGTDIFVSTQSGLDSSYWIRKFPNVLTTSTVPSKKINLISKDIRAMKVAGGTLYAVGRSWFFNPLSTSDAFTAKYDSNLNIIWTKQFGTPGLDGLTGLATKANQNAIFPVGYTYGNFNNSTTRNDTDGFVARLNTTNGSTVWLNQ